MRHPIPVVLIAVAGLTGCDMVLGTPDGYLAARVEDADRAGTDSSAAGDFTGTGSYDVYLKDRDLDGVSITSHGVGDSDGDQVLFRVLLHDWPRGGEYSLSLTPEQAAQANQEGAAAQYSVTRPDSVQEIYWVDAGRLVISEMHRRYMEGSFTMTGRLCLVVTPPPDRTYEGPCAGPPPIVIPDSARTTGISGTFRVTTEEPAWPTW